MPSLDDGNSSGAGTTATVAGWGLTSQGGSRSNVLHSVDLKLLTNAQCEAYGYRHYLYPSSICAIGDLEGGEDSCQGDSGGPLFVQQARALTAPTRPTTRPHRRLASASRLLFFPPSAPAICIVCPTLTPIPLTDSPLLGCVSREGWTPSSALSRGAGGARGRASQASTRAFPLSKPGLRRRAVWVL